MAGKLGNSVYQSEQLDDAAHSRKVPIERFFCRRQQLDSYQPRILVRLLDGDVATHFTGLELIRCQTRSLA